MRTLAPLAFAAISGVVLFKLFATILLPLLVGLIAMSFKITLIAGVVFFIYSMMRKRREEAEV